MNARARGVGVGLLVCALALLAGCSKPLPPACEPQSCGPHTVILVRHAEKAESSGQDADPELSPRGRERAARLATLLARTAPSRLLATEFKRTRETLEPLSERVGKTIETSPAVQFKGLVRELRDSSPGSVTVVATHANVLPGMAEALGGKPLRDVGANGSLADSDYGRVVVIALGCGPGAVVELSSD